MQLQTAGGRIEFGQKAGPSPTSMREEQIERERLGEIERERKRGGEGPKKRRFTLPMTNQS